MTEQVSPPFNRSNMPVWQLLFSFKGRIARSTWWATFVISVLACLLTVSMLVNTTKASPSPHPIAAIAFVAIFAFAVWVNLAIGAKRWHDMDRTAWLCLVLVIPFIGLIAFIFYGFVRGSAGPNKYGANPLAVPASVDTQLGVRRNERRLDMGLRFEKATTGDIILSIIIPGWGVLIGLIALCKGEKKRAGTMIIISAGIIFLFILSRQF